MLTTCESTAAILLHVRDVTDLTTIRLGGHAHPRPLTLCGTEAAWDMRSDLKWTTCKACLQELKKRGIQVETP